MSDACSIQSVRTTWPRMSRPRISLARSAASSGVAASLMTPALPRPPPATSAWAAAAAQARRFDDAGPADLGGRRPRLLGRERDAPVRGGDAEAREELL